jgi:hypothetical protein
MAWFTRFDRFGGTHMCFSQEQARTCTLACAKMVLYKINKLRPGYNPSISEARVEQIYQKFDEQNMPVWQGGGYLWTIAKVLNELNLGTWQMYNGTVKSYIYYDLNRKAKCTQVDVAGGIIDTWRSTKGYPMILSVNWDTGGSHAVVLDSVRRRGSSGSDNVCGETSRSTSDNGWGTICDPLDGDVHVLPLARTPQQFGLTLSSQELRYTPKRSKWSFNAWGKAAHNEIATGALEGRVVDFLYCTQKS